VDVRIGLVGSGFMARTYAQCIARHTTGVTLAGVTGGSRAAALAADYGVPLDADVAAMLARPDVDAVLLATPHSTHLALTEAAAAAGKHVYVEKPMGRTVAECDAMIAACEAAGVVLTVNKVTRFRASPRHAKAIVDGGGIGVLRMLQVRSTVTAYLGDGDDWTKDPAEGGAWLDMGAHLCDATRWFTGSEVEVVFGTIGDFDPRPGVDLLRSASVQLRMANGVRVQILMSLQLPEPGLGSQSQWTFIGSTGIVECDAYGLVRHGDASGWRDIYEMPAFAKDSDVLSPVRLAAFAEQVQDFADAIREGRRPATTGADGRAAIAIVEAALASSASGQAVAPVTAG
jgi:predicted dehydrogenase